MKGNEVINDRSGDTNPRYSEKGALDTCLPSINKMLLDKCNEQILKACTDFIANNSGETDVLKKFGITLDSIASHVKVKVDEIDAMFLITNASINAEATVTSRFSCYCTQESTAYFRCGKKFWQSMDALAFAENSNAVGSMNFGVQWSLGNLKKHLLTHIRHYKTDQNSTNSKSKDTSEETHSRNGESNTRESYSEADNYNENSNSVTPSHLQANSIENSLSPASASPIRNFPSPRLTEDLTLSPAKPFHEESQENQIEIILAWLQNGQPVDTEILKGDKKLSGITSNCTITKNSFLRIFHNIELSCIQNYLSETSFQLLQDKKTKLENDLYTCPKCGKEITGSDNSYKCDKCLLYYHDAICRGKYEVKSRNLDQTYYNLCSLCFFGLESKLT